MTDHYTRNLDLPASVELVWRAVTDPAWLTQWLAEEAELELVAGGEARFLVEGERRTGWVEEVSPPRGSGVGRLAFWWQAEGEPASRVALELVATPTGTRLQVAENRPLELLDLVGIPLRGAGRSLGHRPTHGPALVAV